MQSKKRSLIALLLLLLFQGAAGWPEAKAEKTPGPRALGREFATFQAPRKPPADHDQTAPVQEPRGILTLTKALELALRNNPGLAARGWEIQSAEARRAQSGLWSNPVLEVELEEFGGSGGLSGFDAAETVIRLEHEIELSGLRSRRMRVAALEKDLAAWDFESARLDLITEVTRRFLETLAAQRRLALADEILALDEATLATVRERVDAGKDPPVEKSKAQVILSMAEIERMRARRELEAARQRLAQAWGGLTPQFDSVADDFESVTAPPPLEPLVALLAQNPELARRETEIERRHAMLSVESRSGIPAPSVFGGYKHFQETGGFAYLVGLSVPLPLFNRNQGAVREAKFNLAQAKSERRAAEAGIRADLVSIYEELSEAHASVEILKNEILPSARDAFEAALKGYRSGKFQYLVVLDAQRTLFEARGGYVAALEAYHHARTGVERLIGAELASLAMR
jgi:cobalt-zinc-cadmium efflux system outer membrane protein